MAGFKAFAWLTLIATTGVHAAFPGEQWTRAERPAWNPAALGALFDYAATQRSTGVVIVQDGELIAERYWPPGTEDRYRRMLRSTTPDGRTLEDVASVQKSIVSLLVGMAQSRGLLNPDQAVSVHLGDGWSSAATDAERAITVRHLLTMTSGLTPTLTSEAPAGGKWSYNTRAYSKLVNVLEAATGEDIDTLTRRWLTGPLQMNESSWQPRPWVTENIDANVVGFVTSARDLARFGVLMLNNASWAGTDLLENPGYYAASISPSQSLNPAYCYLWWLNGRPLRRAGERTHDSMAPAAPGDVYAAQGALGRKLYVAPSLNLVVTRLGDAPEQDFNQELWRRLMATMPEPAICMECGTSIADRPSDAQATPQNFITWREHI
ncbi:MAG: serine hydrolase, partial [Gammaproteobacteria bacterium]